MVDVTMVYGTVKAAAAAAQTVWQASKSLENADLKMMIAQLAQQLADASLQMAELKLEVLTLQEENSALKTAKASGTPRRKWGCYEFDGEEGLFCPKCWELHRRKSPANRVNSQRYRCAVCDTNFPAG